MIGAYAKKKLELFIGSSLLEIRIDPVCVLKCTPQNYEEILFKLNYYRDEEPAVFLRSYRYTFKEITLLRKQIKRVQEKSHPR